MRMVNKQKPLWILVLSSFCEGTFSPIPTDPVLAGYVLQFPEDKIKMWLAVSLASALGAVVSYMLGSFFFYAIGQDLVELYGIEKCMKTFLNCVKNYGFWALLLKPFIPLPFKFSSMVFGVAGYNFWIFTCLTVLMRHLRYLLVLYLTLRFGSKYRKWILSHLSRITFIYIASLMVALVGTVYFMMSM